MIGRRRTKRIGRCLRFGTVLLLMQLFSRPAISRDEPGLLFYLSGEKGATADFARGDPEPSAINDVEIIPDGARGKGFRCVHFTQLMGYWAAGNIYAERGTLAFFWRARDPIGKTPFPIFQVSYTDHSSIDMAWLRIDYNGHGFDAFVTDASLARARVSYAAESLPKPEQWLHFALAWDETQGVRFYINGKLAGKKDGAAVFYAGLDQFGAHGDVIGPQDVATMEQFQRGGDIDEIRIYDQMLSTENVTQLARGEPAINIKPVIRTLDNPVYREEWWLRYGWNRPGDNPPYLYGSSVKVRKVEIHQSYDQKQWFWKANDGIRETTWPGVYNRSQLAGRNDYFPRPDWNCYSTSGKSVTFTLPNEPWNHLEISGSAFGSVSLQTFDKETQKSKEAHLFDRPRNQEHTFHRLQAPIVGGKVRFENEVQETPIGEFSAYYVTSGKEPRGITQLAYTITRSEPQNPTLDSLVSYINGRFLPDERTIMVALPAGASRFPGSTPAQSSLPLVHLLIPYEFRVEKRGAYKTAESPAKQLRFQNSDLGASYTWENLYGGLDGVALDLPALKVKPTHGEFFPLTVQIKDPLWPDRNMLDFTFSVRPGEAKTLWLDTRDRILPPGYPLYITIAGAGSDFTPDSLEGSHVRLVFKSRAEASTEHEIDRWTQVRDNVGNMVEWGPNQKKFKMYDRYSRDISDLFRVNPHHEKARQYWSYFNPEQGWLPFEQPKAPAGVPVWAFRQVELLKLYKQFINWWIDNRQIENGEYGGGLSDDGDLTHLWPGAALMGIEPQKITHSIHKLMEAFYANGMFTNGLNTIMTDQLHTYEEGIDVQTQLMALEYGDPKIVERIMETANALERITGLDTFGHRHIRSWYFSATQISEDPIWASSVTRYYSYLILHPGQVLVEYNGNPKVKRLLLELADGLLAHRKKDTRGKYYLPNEILFPSGEEGRRGFGIALDNEVNGLELPGGDSGGMNFGPDIANFLWAAWRWTGDNKYLSPVFDNIEQGDEFDALRYLSGSAIDFLGKRETWGKRILSILGEGKPGLDRLNPTSGFFGDRRSTSDLRKDFFRHVAWQVTGEKKFLEENYADQIRAASQRMSMFTEDHWWIDHAAFPALEIQRSRLGGLAAFRNATYPGHAVSWKFKPPATDESVAILVQEATTQTAKIIAFNLENQPAIAVMTAWNLDPGTWDITIGVESDGDNLQKKITRRETVRLERTTELEIRLEPKLTTVVELKFRTASAPLWGRPDLGIGPDDVKVRGNRVTVTVHSLGSVDAPATSIELRDPSGRAVASARVPAIKAPLDLLPKTFDVAFEAPQGKELGRYEVRVNPRSEFDEITTRNNSVVIQ